MEDMLIVFSVPALVLVIGLFIKYIDKRHVIHIPGTSVLLSHYAKSPLLLPLASGKIGGMRFTMITTFDASVVLYSIELPFSTKLHLLGVPKRRGVVRLKSAATRNFMERVDLEGDYGKYFDLYAEKDQQTQTRYVLDPKAMGFTVDFCLSHNWEIINNELYFLQAAENSPDDPTTMDDDIVEFVKQIRPALAKELTPTELRNATPYGKDRRAHLPCPICSSPMPNTEHFFICTQGHGILLSGKKLFNLNAGKLKVTLPSEVPGPERKDEITCPACEHQMYRIQFKGGTQTIDSCTHCPYRWLDAPEVARIQKRKRY